jgi:hypothetical protein
MDGELHGVEAELEMRRLRLNLGQLESNYDALALSKVQSEGLVKALGQAMRTIAETLIPERLTEMARQDPLGLQRLGAMELARLVQVEAASKMYRLEAARVPFDADRVRDLEAKIQDKTASEAAMTAAMIRLEADFH